MAGSDKQRLFEMLKERAYREGDFTLASGKKSKFYFDAKTILLDGDGARLVANMVLDEIARRDLRPVAVGGMELGAVPLACAVSALAPSSAPPRIFIVRKKPKEHGTGQAVEGKIGAGDRVIVVDDVVTTGESTWKALQAVEALGANVVGIFALMDRQEGHLPEFDRYRDRFFPLFTIAEFRSQKE